MNQLKYITLLCLSGLLLLAVSCDKDTTETKPYMYGEVQTNFPTYVQKGTIVTAKAWGIDYPQEVTWKWYASSMTSDTLVCNPVTVAVPDSIGEFGIMAGAYCDGYYASTTTALFYTIDTAGTETFYGPVPSATHITDPRDGRSYDYITAGNLDWFSQNLAWFEGGTSYLNSGVLDIYFGRLYTWEEALTACPKGWRLPTNDDWADLASAVSGKNLTWDDPDFWSGVGEKLSVNAWFLGEKMWEYWPKNEHTNTIGWNAIPVGYAMKASGVFNKAGIFAFFWSATEATAEKAYYRCIYDMYGEMPFSSTNKTDAQYSVRCVRDKQPE